MGRHSYAASYWQDIVRYGTDVLSEGQRLRDAIDIRREIALHLQFGTPMFRMPYYLEEVYSPLDLSCFPHFFGPLTKTSPTVL